MNILVKAKKYPAGTRRKWADGTYVKGSDHKWHKEKRQELAQKQLKTDKKDKDPELVEDFHAAVEDYIEHLVENNLHPEKATPDTDQDFWAYFFDDEDWYDEPSYLRFAKKVLAVAKKFHNHLIEEAMKEIEEDRKFEAEQKKKEQEKAKRVGKIQKRDTIKFKNPIHAAKAASLIEARKSTHSYVENLDGKEIKSRYEAQRLMGFAIEVGGVRGVVANFWTSRQRVGYRKLVDVGIPHFQMVTDKGIQKVANVGPITLLGDPMRDQGSVKVPTSVKKAGISEIAFDADIPSYQQKSWQNKMDEAFSEFNKKLKLSLNGKVKIHVYGSGGPKRGALADYSPREKVIRLSTRKSGSSEALAHELGHAIDDKLNDWYGTNSWRINDVVRAFRSTPQGKREQERLAMERTFRRRASNYTSWMNKDEEVFARCFETYVAEKCPGWVKNGLAKKVVDDESWPAVKKAMDALMKSDKIKKAFQFILLEEIL